MGMEVVAEAGTVASAVTAAAELRPDAALVDVGLPDGDGVTLARRARRAAVAPAHRAHVVRPRRDESRVRPQRRRGRFHRQGSPP